MKIEYGLGHRDGTVTGPFDNEEEILENMLKVGGSPVARTKIWDNQKNEWFFGKWKDLDPVHGLMHANPLYNKKNSVLT